MNPLLARSVFALGLPASVGVLVPWLIARSDPARGPGCLLGLGLVASGAAVVAWCVRDFYVVGRGTLAPWSPPGRLVVAGLYRVVRNPMYIGLLMLVAGVGWWLTSPLVVVYGVFLAAAVHVRVVFFEERRLQRQFPEQWQAYASAVRRWVPRTRPWGEKRSE